MNLKEHTDTYVMTDNDITNPYMTEMLHFRFIMSLFPPLVNALNLLNYIQQSDN